jgi:hypothetical protein
MSNHFESFDNKALQAQSSLLNPDEQTHPDKVFDTFSAVVGVFTNNKN